MKIPYFTILFNKQLLILEEKNETIAYVLRARARVNRKTGRIKVPPQMFTPTTTSTTTTFILNFLYCTCPLFILDTDFQIRLE